MRFRTSRGLFIQSLCIRNELFIIFMKHQLPLPIAIHDLLNIIGTPCDQEPSGLPEKPTKPVMGDLQVFFSFGLILCFILASFLFTFGLIFVYFLTSFLLTFGLIFVYFWPHFCLF